MGVISAMVVSSFCDLPAAAGGGNRRSAAEGAFISLSGWACCSAGPPRPRTPGDFCTHKSHQKALGRPWPRPPSLGLRPIHLAAPIFYPIGHLQRGYPVAAEFLPGLRPPRNRCGGLRTSPDGPRAESGFLFCGREPKCLPQTQEARHRNQDSPAPSKGRQAKSDTQPAADRMPEGIWPLLWLRSIKSGSVRLGKPGSGVPPAAFWLLCRRGQSNPRLRRGIPPNSLEG